jgi:endonuclease YncB( thermonuclease family)
MTDRSAGETPSSAETPMSRERVLELLQAEVDRQGPLDETRRAAALIGESSIRFVEGSETPGYVIVGSDGQPRTTVQDGRSVPFTLQDLAAELRRTYPALFKPEAPDGAAAAQSSEPSEKAPPARDWLVVGSAEPARRIETPEAGVEGPVAHVESPVARVEATASSIGGLAETTRNAARDGARAALAKALIWKERWSRARQPSHRPTGLNRQTETVPDVMPVAGGFRPSYAIYAGAILVLGALATLVFLGSDSEAPPSSAPVAQAPSRSAPSPTTPAPAPAPPLASSVKPAGALSGVPEVVDTSTLRIDGKIVRLFGVEWERGAQAEDLTRYIAGREVVCTPAARSDRHRCQVAGRDLSEVVLYNGGGRTTADATPELKAAEEKARAGGLGVWQKP